MPDRSPTSRGALEEILEQCGAFAVGVRVATAPARVRLRLRAQLATVLAMAFSAGEHDEAKRATAWARRSAGPHPLLGTSARVGRMEAILASATRARGGEWALLGRTGAPACVVALCLGAPAGLSRDDLDSAQLAAVELGARFGLATVLGPHLFEDAPCVAAVAGSVAAARVLGLPSPSMTAAIAGALAQPQLSSFRSRDVTHTAAATLDGMIAAELAFEGRRAPSLATDGPLSFARGAFVDLGKSWFAETIHIDEHAAPVSAQTALDAAREVAAQVHASRRAPLRAEDVRAVEVETTAFGHALRDELARAVAAVLSTTSERVRVRHAWELTSALLFSVAEATDPRALFAGVTMRELAGAPVLLRRIAEGLGLEAPPLGQLAADLSRAWSLRSGSLHRLALPFGNRVTLTTNDGARYAAERMIGRGAPDASDDRVLAIARERFLAAASPHLGGWRAQRAFEAIVDPPARQTAATLLERLEVVS